MANFRADMCRFSASDKRSLLPGTIAKGKAKTLIRNTGKGKLAFFKLRH